jgi:hypothetical protein
MLLGVAKLFGDGGEFAYLRSRINGVICFGNPATQGTGIARRVLPGWLNALTRNVNHPNDFYAVANDKIRPLFYEWFVKAETEIPFVVYCAQIILPAIANLMPGIGGMVAAPLSLLLSVIPGGHRRRIRAAQPETARAAVGAGTTHQPARPHRAHRRTARPAGARLLRPTTRVRHRCGIPPLTERNHMFTLTWLKDAVERAVKTFAQSLLATLTLGGVDVLHLDWGQTLAVGGTAAVISVLTSVVSAGVGNSGTASLTSAVEPAVNNE